MLGFIFGITVGGVLAYVFHPQLEKLLIKTVRYIKKKSAQSPGAGPEDQG